MAKSIECKCDPRFTCGHCLRNMNPYYFNGIPVIPDAIRHEEPKS